MFKKILQNDPELDQDVVDSGNHLGLVQQLLLFSTLGLAVHGFVVGAIAQTLSKESAEVSGFWLDGQPMLWIPLSLVVAFLGAIAICLPSFYFFTQVAGLNVSLGLTVIQSLRVMARTGILLLGLLPFYLAYALLALLGFLQVDSVVFVGLAAPFLIGLAGISGVYRSFSRLVTVLPITHERRGNFVLRFVLCWGLLYLTVAPLALWRIGEVLAKIIA